MNALEIEDLVAQMFDLTDEQAEDADLDDLIFDKFGVEFEQFAAIVDALIPYTIPAKAALSGKVYQGFVKDGAFIVKKPAA